ncbi:hypothetical protein V499_09084 [Pseudogymnoascus sp. VKM F-103]|nr:hypothetical protein V499_09084 [Pseudogymnoascus sp. VKM F-103]
MFFSLPTIALAASLLSSSVLAVPHRGHRHLHAAAKRDAAVLVDRDVVVVNTVTDWVTVWWDGTSFVTPTATSANAIPTQAAAADAAKVEADAKAKAAAEAPAPIITAAPAAPAPVAPAVAVADTGAADAAAAEAASKASAEVAASQAAAAQAAASQAAANEAAKAAASAAANDAAKAATNAAAAAAKNPEGIVAGVVGAISSVVAPIIPTPVAPVISTPTPVVVTPPVVLGAAKRGLAYNNAALASGFTGADSKVSWAYNWGSTTPAIPSSFEYVPMIWGPQPIHSDGWTEAANAAIAKGSKHLLAFNEPDLPSQANLDVGTAAAGYKTFMQPFAGKARLGSPAVTNGPAPMGIAYFKSFMAACDGCTVDFVPMHWYDSASNVEGFKTHVNDMRDAAEGRKLWITEFGASGSNEDQENFLREVIPWLDSNDAVERYAYFYADGALTQNSVVSALGNVFKTFVS